MMAVEFAQIFLKMANKLQRIQIQHCGWPFKIIEKIKLFINRYTENVEANKIEIGKKPWKNVQEEENINDFLLPVPVMAGHLNHEFA